jgi:hypothetical protein
MTYKKSVSKDLKRLSHLEASRILNQIEKQLVSVHLNFPNSKENLTGYENFGLGDIVWCIRYWEKKCLF